jgi:hypothetical protein
VSASALHLSRKESLSTSLTLWKDPDTTSLIESLKDSSIGVCLLDMRQDLVLQTLLALAIRPDSSRRLDIRTPILGRHDKFSLQPKLGIGQDLVYGSRGVTGGFRQDEGSTGVYLGRELGIDAFDKKGIGFGEEETTGTGFGIVCGASDRDWEG